MLLVDLLKTYLDSKYLFAITMINDLETMHLLHVVHNFFGTRFGLVVFLLVTSNEPRRILPNFFILYVYIYNTYTYIFLSQKKRKRKDKSKNLKLRILVDT